MIRRRRPTRFLAAIVTAGTVIAGVAVSLTSGPAVAENDSLDAQFIATHQGPQQYPNVYIDWDVPITMSDGTVLKGNVYRPADASGQPVAEPMPTIVNLTPYTKLIANIADSALAVPGLGEPLLRILQGFDLSAYGMSGLSDLMRALPGGAARTFGVDRKLVQSGYTQVVVDVRGTGFSQGMWQVFGDREQQDGAEVVDWAAAQPWSNGKIGMSGISYSAINQLHTAERQPAALRAIFPIVPGSDLIRDVAAPGGALGIGFIPEWLLAVDGTKLIPDLVSIIGGKFDWTWLADRVRDPFTFFNLIIEALATPSIDQIKPEMRAILDEDSALRTAWIGHPERITVPTFVYGGWHDIFTYSSPRIFNAVNVPDDQKKLVMGDTYHVTTGAGLGLPGAPPALDVLQRAWFDKWLKGIDNGIDGYDQVHLWQQGGGWTTAPSFPRPGMDYRRMYLDAASSGTAPGSAYDGSLTAAPGGPARVTIAPGLSTLCSRDAAHGTAGIIAAFDVCTKDARISETNALTFTTAPVRQATQISGPIAVHLNTVLDATDGYWTVTVNDVAPDGRSTVWSTGQRTASLRAVDDAKSTRSPNGDYTDPYPILTLDSRRPIVPGQPTVVDLGVFATDGVLQPGHRLRVDVFAGNFPSSIPLRPLLNESELKPQHLQLDPNEPSWVNIPVAGDTGW
ncbi:putative hydrolase [Nocardia brasiliensis NBRC 14402]|uniref:CocE/NonD family hydrolase n=1 Tax=Nocardia brasiliensis TaxID=37326 RepID=UPI00030D6866|nr:CocE/NonD family hydrolase [Nocardia brasiliensis]AVL26512.1 peptidase S15 [Nocardia brasiliensis]GAJ82689.1 putative hydrolase [Nocardia brasiliensis NBRC 14402]SUB09610.1 Cocaine esterase [Nocardia brasiliensis]